MNKWISTSLGLAVVGACLLGIGAGGVGAQATCTDSELAGTTAICTLGGLQGSCAVQRYKPDTLAVTAFDNGNGAVGPRSFCTCDGIRNGAACTNAAAGLGQTTSAKCSGSIDRVSLRCTASIE